ncbi:transcription factor LBX1-like [Mytilus galloprovincialis]|uniref:Homeobox protein LBX n=3 Tax=Mytilus TaxID=6548 RepID=A0A8B6H1N2_MYTGA|nr:homeobox protein LBX [Mytilus galloprovincialis]
MKIMSTSSGVSDSEDSCRDQYEPIRKLAMVQIHPPRNPNKPFTSFCIKDILSSNNVSHHQRNFHFNNCANSRIVRPWDIRSSSGRDSELSSDAEDEEINVDDDEPVHQINKSNKVSPLDALMEMANKTFEGLETAESAETKRREQAALFGKHQPPKKRRKSRTAFTNQQIYELEKRFLYQKYLTPADRDEIAQTLGLTNAQVITWFQNRRAKLKRDLEELKNDVTAANSAGEETVKALLNSDDESRDSSWSHSPPKVKKTCVSETHENDRPFSDIKESSSGNSKTIFEKPDKQSEGDDSSGNESDDNFS